MELSDAQFRGRRALHREIIRRRIAQATQAHARQAVAAAYAEAAIAEALFGSLRDAKAAAIAEAVFGSLGDAKQAAVDGGGAVDWNSLGMAALVVALAGDVARAQTLAADLDRRYPERTAVQFYYLPAIRAAMALSLGKPDDAVEDLRAGASYDLLESPVEMLPVYLRGQAYLSAHRGTEAAAEFQRLLDTPARSHLSSLAALASLGLGRASALTGDGVKARKAYEDFFALWKHADPDIPILQRARTEYSLLLVTN
jgi:hypothetical protein